MQLNIKQLILEGYSYEEITEAVHANHPELNKKGGNFGKKIYRQELADDLKNIRVQRDMARKAANGYQTISDKISKPIIADTINLPLVQADKIVTTTRNPFLLKANNAHKKANYYDNLSRVISSSNEYNKYINENDPIRILKNIPKTRTNIENMSESQPRIISSAKQ